MVQFRRSKNIGPIRITASKGGLGASVGAGPVRVGKGADGKVRGTVRIPGTGIYDTRVIGGETSQPAAAPTTQNGPQPPYPNHQTQASATRGQPIVLPAPMHVKAYNGTVVFDGRTIWITRNRAGKLTGLNDLAIPITDVIRVEWKPPNIAVNGTLRIVTPQSQDLGGKLPPPDPHGVWVTWQGRKRIAPLLEALAATGAPIVTR